MVDLPDAKKLYRVDEVAEFYEVTRQCVYLWEQHGKIDGVRRPGKPLMITRESILRWEGKLQVMRSKSVF